MTGTEAGASEPTIDSILDLEGKARHSVSRLQHFVDRAADLVGRPAFVFILIAISAAWLTFNGCAPKFGYRAFDQPPFADLELIVTLVALLLAAIIVATQRREDRLAERRAQLTLHLSILADQKNAKIIALLEEIRRDSPTLSDRVDPESDAMSAPADTGMLLDKIDRTSGKPIPL